MRISVPETMRVYPYAGIAGLGQDDGFDDGLNLDTSPIDTTTLPLTTGTLDYSTLLGTSPTTIMVDGVNYAVSDTSPVVTPPAVAPANAPYGYDELGQPLTAPATSGLSTLCTDASCQQMGSKPTAAQLAGIVTSGTSSGLNATQIAQIFSSAAQAGVAVFKATSSPALIPGTNLVYNPATGQIANALTGLTGAQASLGGLSFGTILLFGGGLLLIMMLSGKK